MMDARRIGAYAAAFLLLTTNSGDSPALLKHLPESATKLLADLAQELTQSDQLNDGLPFRSVEDHVYPHQPSTLHALPIKEGQSSR